jgi:hypothetical protein
MAPVIVFVVVVAWVVAASLCALFLGGPKPPVRTPSSSGEGERERTAA